MIYIEKNSNIKNVFSVLDLNYIQDIQDYIVTLSNGKRLSIVRVETINFNLKTNSEQQTILESYKTFLKQCDFDIQIYIQTQKINTSKHIEKIKSCIKYEAQISEMAEDYIELINKVSESKSGISKKFYIIFEEKEDDSRILIITEGLKSCGNIVKKCDKEEILNLFNVCFKKQLSNRVAPEG